MRTLAIGDIHGCSTALDTLLALVRPTPEDRLILLGDVVDRGPNSRGVLEMILALHGQTRLITVRGNHEEMMQRARRGPIEFAMWFAVGGKETLDSYHWDGAAEWSQIIPARHWDFLDHGLCDWYEEEQDFFVHANVHPDLALTEQPGEILRWEMFQDVQPAHGSGKRMICGHTAQRSGIPARRPHGICIDTWVYGRGWLTALEVGSGQYWQANQQGQTRTFMLEECEQDTVEFG